MKQPFWKTDWFIGFIFTLIMVYCSGIEPIQKLERLVYDLGVWFTPARKANDQIIVVAIDAKSIDKFGAWPWSRRILEKCIDNLASAGVAAIGINFDLSDLQEERSLAQIEKLKNHTDSVGFKQLNKNYQSQFKSIVQKIEWNLTTDKRLSRALQKAKNVVLGIPYFKENSKLSVPIKDQVEKKFSIVDADKIKSLSSSWLNSITRPQTLLSARHIHFPHAQFNSAAKASGTIGVHKDSDEIVRADPLLVKYGDSILPSMSVMLFATSMGLGVKDILVQGSNRIDIGHQTIKTNSHGQLMPFNYTFNTSNKSPNIFSIYDIYKGKINADRFENSIVVIGIMDTNIVEPIQISKGDVVAPTLFLANSISSLLNNEYYFVPQWAHWIELSALLVIGFYLGVILPRIKTSIGFVVTAVIVVAMLNSHLTLMATQGIWLHLVAPMTLLIVGYTVLTSIRRYRDGFTGLHNEISEANRMLGLALQSHGQLDMAFEKFMKCRLNDSLLEVLYILGLDYERKRQFAKAGSVFRYMSEYNPEFRDIKKRIMSNFEMEGIYVHGTNGNSGLTGTLVLNKSGIQKPMLGRYEIIKELGRGAMGMVYKGVDPKIDRIVAIKTMALSQEFEGSQLQSVKERFFHEAKTVGRITHPNIVTVYDVGEEHDLAYIAMDYLEGENLVCYTQTDNLLPISDVIYIISKLADALDYAHRENVVHRDVKPANVMYHAELNKVTLMDFGVACLTDSSKTKTGTVLGTPSYMSPEQLAGQKVDGRSDLFSLGVMFFQLTCGELPFVGDSMANLMFKITNEKHPDIRLFRSDLPACMSRTVNKLLKKEADKRYQTGNELMRALERCAESLQTKKKAAQR